MTTDDDLGNDGIDLMASVKRGRGRPSEGERVEVRIPADLLAVVDRAAEAAGVKRAEQVRRILSEWKPSTR